MSISVIAHFCSAQTQNMTGGQGATWRVQEVLRSTGGDFEGKLGGIFEIFMVAWFLALIIL